MYLPPTLDELLAWSKLFRCARTYANHVGYLRTGCMVCKAPVEVCSLVLFQTVPCSDFLSVVAIQVFADPALKRGKGAIAKANLFAARAKQFIGMQMVERMAKLAGDNPDCVLYAKLWVLTYAFLLRLPSEALPTKSGPCEGQSSLELRGNELVLRLKRRCGQTVYACVSDVLECLSLQEKQAGR